MPLPASKNFYHFPHKFLRTAHPAPETARFTEFKTQALNPSNTMTTKLIHLSIIASFALQSRAADFSIETPTQPEATVATHEGRQPLLFVIEGKRTTKGIRQGKK